MKLASKLAIDEHVGQLVPTKAKQMKQYWTVSSLFSQKYYSKKDVANIAHII